MTAESRSSGDNHAGRSLSLSAFFKRKRKTTTKTTTNTTSSSGSFGTAKPNVEAPKPEPTMVTDPTFNKAPEQNTSTEVNGDIESGGKNNGSSQSGANLYSYLHNGRKRRGASDLRITGLNRGYQS